VVVLEILSWVKKSENLANDPAPLRQTVSKLAGGAGVDDVGRHWQPSSESNSAPCSKLQGIHFKNLCHHLDCLFERCHCSLVGHQLVVE